MPENRDPAPENQDRVLLDLNNRTFQANWLDLEKTERNRVTDTLNKIRQLSWGQVYRDKGLKWEKIRSTMPVQGFGPVYSLRVTQARRATVCRDGAFMRFLTVQPDRDSTYGKK